MATGTTAQQTVDVVTPAAGESVTEGTILEWHVKVGDPIKLDETIVEISTDKVDVELPSPASGTVSEILVAEGDTVTVGQVIARISLGDQAPGNGASAESTGRPPTNGNGAVKEQAAAGGEESPPAPAQASAATAEAAAQPAQAPASAA